MDDAPNRLRITHDTRYDYSAAVFLEPQTLRFGLRAAPYASVAESALEIDPTPAGRRECLDEEGNAVVLCWFAGTTDHLAIRATTTVAVGAYNPLGFLLHPPSASRLPLAYAPGRAATLAPHREPLEVSADLLAFGEAAVAAAGHDTLGYLLDLTRAVHARTEVVYREVGAPYDPAETFARARGSCRDVAWMTIGLLRAQGLAARFTSGYLYFASEAPAYELHAWVEVFLPGAGWCGLDPSQGVVAGNGHLPIVSSAHYRYTMPVAGGFRGRAEATLATALAIETV